MNKTCSISAEDVVAVAERLRFNPTIADIKEVLDGHESACRIDPTATWNLIVENQLYDLGVEQLPK